MLRTRGGKQRPNICCVGDDDQSIYGWRGAEVENILRFDKDFPGATVIRLERNYRSTGHILAAASHVIAKNKGRLGKTLFTDGAKGEKVTVTGVWDDTEEARIVGEDIEAYRQGRPQAQPDRDPGAAPRSRCARSRTASSRSGMPYRVIGGPRFYERAEIKDAIAYLEVVHNPTHDLKFERIVNVPKRGIGDTTVNRIIALSRARGIPLAIAAGEMIQADDLTPKTRKSLGDLLRSIERWRCAHRRHEAHRACRADPRRERLHGDAAGRQEPAGAVAAGEPEGTRALHARLRHARRVSSSTCRW